VGRKPHFEGYMMNKDLRSYLKIYSDWLTPEVCQETVDELELVEGQFQTHQFYDYHNNSNHSYEHELAVTWSNVKHKEYIMQRIWDGLQRYHQELAEWGCDWYATWQGYTEVRFNRYRENTNMKLHCDHIHSMFDGQRKGIPTLTILGGLNGGYEGGDLVFWQDTPITLKAGEIMIFPSNFLYPHRVDLVTKGTRYSYVSWTW
jgi:hypothetical protein